MWTSGNSASNMTEGSARRLLPEYKGHDEPKQHDQNRHAHARHPNKRRPSLLLVAPEPLVSFGQPKAAPPRPASRRSARRAWGGKSGGSRWGRSSSSSTIIFAPGLAAVN